MPVIVTAANIVVVIIMLAARDGPCIVQGLGFFLGLVFKV